MGMDFLEWRTVGGRSDAFVLSCPRGLPFLVATRSCKAQRTDDLQHDRLRVVTRELPLGTLSLELRSVNHRYLDIQFRLPDELRPFEPACAKCSARS